MKKIVIFFVALVFSVGCKKESKKGSWLENDKKDFLKNCTGKFKMMKDTKEGEVLSALANLEELGNKSCECALKKFEQTYDNPSQAKQDDAGASEILKKCGEEAMKELMKVKE
ncbi:MAG: hypothetical protein RMJ97_04405 [Raineya sp.]|nr:hypothetical protein [Raineya sp.]MDW8296107.1 hypothetical protein [Raineya sp.]